MHEPLVTVFSMCYNQAQYVVESLESIRNQTYKNIQLIISDDSSSDSSVDTIRNWIKEHGIECTFIAHEKNQGICKTLNELLTHAKGDYISMLAADDRWYPAKTERQVALMESLPETTGIAYSDSYRIDEAGSRLPEMYIEMHRSFDIPPSGKMYNLLAAGNFLAAQSTLIRKSVYDKIGNYDDRLVYEDWDFWLRAAMQFEYVYSDYVSADYRVVSTSITNQHLQARSVRAEYSDYLILKKCIQSKRLNSENERLFRERLSGIAKRLHWHQHPHEREILITANRYNPSFQTLAMLLKTFIPSKPKAD